MGLNPIMWGGGQLDHVVRAYRAAGGHKRLLPMYLASLETLSLGFHPCITDQVVTGYFTLTSNGFKFAPARPGWLTKTRTRHVKFPATNNSQVSKPSHHTYAMFLLLMLAAVSAA